MIMIYPFQNYLAQVLYATMAEVAQSLAHRFNVHALLDIMAVDVRVKVRVHSAEKKDNNYYSFIRVLTVY